MKKYPLIILALLLSLFHYSCEDALLGPETENTPENNFEVLWKEFDRYYPSFRIKNIDWQRQYNLYRPLVNPQTTDIELWAIITAMMSIFRDSHVYIFNFGNRSYTSNPSSLENDFILDIVTRKYLHNRFQTAGSGIFTYGKLPGDSIGYVYIGTFHTEGNEFNDVDLILRELADVKSIIIDVRDNRGGYATDVEYFASQFSENSISYGYEISRNGPGHDDFTIPALRKTIPRLDAPLFKKPTVVLTNSKTVSAAEVFTLIYKHFPNSTQIGDYTEGAVGGTRGFVLPNGWIFYMPFALYLTLEGGNLENIGVEPDIRIINEEEELYKFELDRQLEYAIEYLSK